MSNEHTDNAASSPFLKVLIVDDEPLARHWLRMQLNKCAIAAEIAEAASAALAQTWLQTHACQVLLLDIHMPGTNGLEFAERCKTTNPDVAIIFTTADSSHALKAFDLAAFDYLTKPVSVERLEQALARVGERAHLLAQQSHKESTEQNVPHLVIDGFQHITRIPLSSILYFQAQSKYIKVVTPTESHLIEKSLSILEEEFSGHVIRVHRGYLVPKHAIEALARSSADASTTPSSSQENWSIKIRGKDTYIPVSRRQLPLVKEVLHTA